jgi:hypothetical protein
MRWSRVPISRTVVSWPTANRLETMRAAATGVGHGAWLKTVWYNVGWVHR